MADVSWSRCDGADCVRITGLAEATDVDVRPSTAAARGGIPPMAGRLVSDGDDVCFVPRFAFVDGTSYTVTVGSAVAAVLDRRRTDRPATTSVLGIWPTAPAVPRNLLRMYVLFSAPMSEGDAARQVRLTDDGGRELAHALLAVDHELWDAERRRLTVLLDPARIKRGLAGHRVAGYPLRFGEPFRAVIGGGFRDARGVRLRAGSQRRYEVGDDERRRIEPGGWALRLPSSRSFEPLEVEFGRPLDHGLLSRCLSVDGPDGLPVAGAPEPGPGERSWRLAPTRAWAPGAHRLVVDPVLEDLAGNSVTGVFDRDLDRPEDDPVAPVPVTVPFRPR